jgi:hypothetical protein
MSKKASSVQADTKLPESEPVAMPFDAVLLICNEYAYVTRQNAFLSPHAPKKRIVGNDSYQVWSKGGAIFLQKISNANRVQSAVFEIDRIQLNRSTLMQAVFTAGREFDRKVEAGFSEIEVEKAKMAHLQAVDDMALAESRFQICKEAIEESEITTYMFLVEMLESFMEHGSFLAAEVKISKHPEIPEPKFPTDFDEWMKSRQVRKAMSQPAILAEAEPVPV